MESIRLYFVLVLITGTLWEETFASMGILGRIRKKIWHKRTSKIWEEAKDDFRVAGSDVRFNLAPSYGSLNSNTLKQLDESLKVMMGGILAMNIHEGITWNEIRYALDTSPLVIRHPNKSVSKFRHLFFNTIRVVGFRANKDKRMHEIHSWFSQLIGNVDILKDTDIDLYQLATMVSKRTLRIMDNIFTNKFRKMTLMDTGILRFPDPSQPFFTLYRINLMGKCTYNTYLVHQKETSHVIGLFQKEVYYPNENYISGISDDIMDSLLSEVDDLFSDI